MTDSHDANADANQGIRQLNSSPVQGASHDARRSSVRSIRLDRVRASGVDAQERNELREGPPIRSNCGRWTLADHLVSHSMYSTT